MVSWLHGLTVRKKMEGGLDGIFSNGVFSMSLVDCLERQGGIV